MSCTLICIPVDLHRLRLILWDNTLIQCVADEVRSGSPDHFLQLIRDFLNEHRYAKEHLVACVVGFGTSSASAVRILSAIWSVWHQVQPIRLASCTVDATRPTVETIRVALEALEDMTLTQLIPRYTRPANVTIPIL